MMSSAAFARTTRWLSSHKKQLGIAAGIVAGVVVCIQLIYPTDSLLPFATIDTVKVGGAKKSEATQQLDARVNATKIPIFVSQNDEAYAVVPPSEIGLKISYEKSIKDTGYPLWARVIPTSLVWSPAVQSNDGPVYSRDSKQRDQFVDETLGGCKVEPKNATIEFADDALRVVSAKDGGTCDVDAVTAALNTVSPTISQPAEARLDVQITKPAVADAAAETLKQSIEQRAGEGVAVKTGDDTTTISAKDVYSWLDFSVKKSTLLYELNEKKSTAYFQQSIAKKVAVPAGVTVITTRDFTELSRINGTPGKALDADQTRRSVEAVLGGKKEIATAATRSLEPKIDYARSYTKTSTGIAALVAQYGEDHSGTYGVSFQELGGLGRSASYNGDQTFITASTYKLFVAYGALKKVEAKEWKWSDEVLEGRNLSACFDDMIVISDNECAQTLYKKIGYQKVIDDVRALGLSSTSLTPNTQQTSANDLMIFLTKLQNSSLGLSETSRSGLLEAMKRNVYRLGIPTGATGQVADKVGFLDDLLHDAAVVYSPKGPYVLVIMSDGSSWANLADLTKKIESLR